MTTTQPKPSASSKNPDKPVFISKENGIRLIELINALQLIKESIEFIGLGRERYLMVLSVQLRKLTAEKTKKSDSLLIWAARLFKQELNLHYTPPADENPLPESSGNLLLISGLPVTEKKQYPSQVSLSIDELFNRKMFKINQKAFTARELIGFYANQEGGAHHSRSVPEAFAAVAYTTPGKEMLANALVQLGQATLLAGARLLRTLSNHDSYTIIGLEDRPIPTDHKTSYIFDSKSPHSPMRISLSLDNRLAPKAMITSIHGQSLQLRSDRLIEWGRTHCIHLSVHMEMDMQTKATLSVDGEIVASAIHPEPIWVITDAVNFETFWNKAHDAEGQDFSFALCRHLVFSREMSELEYANMLLFTEEATSEIDSKVSLFHPNSHGHAPMGSTDLRMSGKVTATTISEWLSPS